MHALKAGADARQGDGREAAMHLAEAVIGISQYVVPALLALGYGEVERNGEATRLLALLWEQGQRWERGQRRALRRSSARSA